MKQNKNQPTIYVFTDEELLSQGYNPATYRAQRESTAKPTRVEVHDESTGPETIEVSEADVVQGVKLAAVRRAIAIDGTTGSVMLPSEVASVDRGVEEIRSR